MIREISFRAAIISKELECHQPILRHVATCTVLAVTKAVVQETFTGSPKVPKHEILGAQHLSSIYELSFPSRPKTDISHLLHLGTSRVHHCSLSLKTLKDDFQSILCSLRTLMFII